MSNFEVTDYTLSVYDLNLEYFLNDYYYNVKCDFDWSDECTGSYIDFTITPLSGTFFHSDTDETGIIEITDDYKQWLQDVLSDYRRNTLWLYNESLEKMQSLETEDFNYWADYGI